MKKKEKNLSLELLKFIAVCFVINSHSGLLYGKYSGFATGGAIGDTLFFFASGFTLFLGRFERFDNWYKRRIKRIYPSVLAWALMLSIMNIRQISMNQIVTGGGYWFISCIMLYYIILYFVRKYFLDRPLIPFVSCMLLVVLLYCFQDSSKLFMYGATSFKWVHFFLFMLAGAYVGNSIIKLESHPRKDFLLLFLFVVLFYGLQFLATRNIIAAHFQIITLLPLMGIVIFSYKLFLTEQAVSIMHSRLGKCLQFVAGLCLEAYMVQITVIRYLATFNIVFPFNLILSFFVIIIIAYLTRCLGRIISQIFQNEAFDWGAVFRLI